MKRIMLGLFVFAISSAAQAVQVPGPLVDTAWLAKNQKNVLILDVRENPKTFTSKPIIKVDKKTRKMTIVNVGGHIPGAVLVNYKKIRANKKVDGVELQKMLPGKAAMESIMQSLGANQDSAIVIVSRGMNNLDMTGATRMYWQLKYYGQDNMGILDGGVAQWLMDGHKVSVSPTSVKKGNWKATAERNDLLATSEDVAKAVKDGSVQLVDNRPISQYLGVVYKKSYVYAPGHIPTAKSFPNELFTAPSAPAKFNSKAKLTSLSEAMGIDPSKTSINYCNSGHLATGGWFYLHEVMGNKNVKMYDGSMHEWTKEKRPVVTMKME
jgi:thiosulfate/3-mercaptopyruvate sulfurtransferase